MIKTLIKNQRHNKDYYYEVLSKYELSYSLFLEYVDDLNIDYLVETQKSLDHSIIRHIVSNYMVDIPHLLRYQYVPNDIICNYLDNDEHIDEICEYQILTFDELDKYTDKLNWLIISKNQFLELKSLIKFIDYIKWDKLVFNYAMVNHINEGFITLFQQTNIWDTIGYSDIDTDTLFKYKDKFTDKTYESLRVRTEIVLTDD